MNCMNYVIILWNLSSRQEDAVVTNPVPSLLHVGFLLATRHMTLSIIIRLLRLSLIALRDGHNKQQLYHSQYDTNGIGHDQDIIPQPQSKEHEEECAERVQVERHPVY